MFVADVVGTVVATAKDPSLVSHKLLLIQPVTPDGNAHGGPQVAIDSVGVGVGERVICVKGKEAGFPYLPEQVLADVGIVAKLDSLHHRPVARR